MPHSIDPAGPWRLSHILEGHSSDVKAVSASSVDEEIELIHTASRDETGRSWFRNKNQLESFQRGSSYQGNRYQNSVNYIKSTSEKGNGMTLLGGLDARILTFESSSSYSEKPQTKTLQTLQDHYDNVCQLRVFDGRASNVQTLLISASWDCTSKVWKRVEGDNINWHHLHTLKGHERAVWAAEVISARKGEEKYLTASADLFIRLWHGEELKRVFAGHTDVVRSIALLPPQLSSSSESGLDLPPFYDDESLFVTASNDGSLRVWSLDDRRCPPNLPSNGGEALRVLKSNESNDLLYEVRFLNTLKETGARVVVSCGEDGLLRGWNVEDCSEVMSIPQPVTSVWSLAVLPHSGDIVTANSDAKVRIFTQRLPAPKSAEQRECWIGEVTKADLDKHERLCNEVKAKKRTSNVDATVIAQEAASPTDEDDSTFEGCRYDSVLKIDVQDDAEPLSLPLNRGDDPRLAARQFIERYQLPSSYEDQIVDFIEQVGPK